jgi:hypothetical protein
MLLGASGAHLGFPAHAQSGVLRSRAGRAASRRGRPGEQRVTEQDAGNCTAAANYRARCSDADHRRADPRCGPSSARPRSCHARLETVARQPRRCALSGAAHCWPGGALRRLTASKHNVARFAVAHVYEPPQLFPARAPPRQATRRSPGGATVAVRLFRTLNPQTWVSAAHTVRTRASHQYSRPKTALLDDATRAAR